MFRPIFAHIGALLLAGSVAASAWAADMPVKALRPVDVGWAGFYFGANAGAGTTTKKFYDIFGPVPDFALDADHQFAGGLAGFQLGYNLQFDRLVLGLQGDFDWSAIKKSFGCFSFGNQDCSADAEWLATFTARAGYLFGPALFYIDGGPAWTRDTVSNIAGSAACAPTGGTVVCSAPNDLFLGSQTRLGWTAGGGVEYRFSPNWSAFAQYNYMDFGSHAITLVDGGTGIFPELVKQNMQVVKVGLNYRLTGPFGGGAALAAVPNLLTGDADDTNKKIRVFSTFDVGKDSVDGTVGALFAFSKDLDTSGLRMYVNGGAGWYQFPDGGGKIRGVYSTGDILAGYGFAGDNYEINLLAGGSAENDMLSAYDAQDPVQGTAFGLKVRGDAYYNPTPRSVIAAEGEYSTAFQTYYTAATYGYDFWSKDFFIGPEVAFFGDARFNQWRVGARFTALKVGRLSFDVSTGFARDSVVGDGAYGHVEMSTSF